MEKPWQQKCGWVWPIFHLLTDGRTPVCLPVCLSLCYTAALGCCSSLSLMLQWVRVNRSWHSLSKSGTIFSCRCRRLCWDIHIYRIHVMHHLNLCLYMLLCIILYCYCNFFLLFCFSEFDFKASCGDASQVSLLQRIHQIFVITVHDMVHFI